MSRLKPKTKRFSNRTILQVLTGSIAAYKAPDLIRAIRQEGGRVVCVQTACSREFVTETVLRTVSGERVYSEMFPKDAPFGVLHTSLADLPDLVLVSPASANFIAKLASGIADDLASCVCLATRSPILIVPAMNDNMYNHPVTQRNIAQLKAIGYRFVDPVEGDLACGRVGIGHIAAPETILAAVTAILSVRGRRK
ncbi:MAG: Coenzyme A biosynthesis bifunctional protein CoaBC [Candidatus Omnitrophica bacterium ADurb.Bin277]|nr:MAG: Coenzyme A biosynthesis bifunctional protein CoaBC [Candidatus Omnitrophica bacterium ADurb.Bin277]